MSGIATLLTYWKTLAQSDPALTPRAGIYVLITLLTIVEGPIAILLAAGGVAAGFLRPSPAFCATTLGNLIADSLWYGVGYFGQMQRLARFARILRIDVANVARLERSINTHAGKLLLFAKITNGLIVPVLIATGMARVPLRRWFPIIFVTNLLNSAVLFLIGYYAVFSLAQVKQAFGYLAVAATIVLIFAASLYVRRLLSRVDLPAGLDED